MVTIGRYGLRRVQTIQLKPPEGNRPTFPTSDSSIVLNPGKCIGKHIFDHNGHEFPFAHVS